MILYELQESPKYVGELAKSLHISHSAASRHLKILKNQEIVRSERTGHRVTYFLNTPELIQAMNERFENVSSYNVAIVCAIGSNIAKPGILAKATPALAGAAINILTVSQTSRQTNMQFTLHREHFVQAHKALHHALCEE